MFDLINWETREKFAEGKIIKLREKRMSGLTEIDFEGHEKYEDQEEMLKYYREYYEDKVNQDTLVKIIVFKILKKLS